MWLSWASRIPLASWWRVSYLVLPTRRTSGCEIDTRAAALHGFEIAEAIGERSGEVFQVEEGSLYPALERMMVRGWIAGKWAEPMRPDVRATIASLRLASVGSPASSPATGE